MVCRPRPSEEAAVAATSTGLGYPNEVVTTHLSFCYAGGLVGIYLWALGSVGELRDKLQVDPHWQLPDDYIVAKSGQSGNIGSRSTSLKSTFGQLGVSMHLIMCTYVDPGRLRQAEGELKAWFRGRGAFVEVGARFDGYTEVVAFGSTRSEKPAIKAEFESLRRLHGGASSSAQATSVDETAVEEVDEEQLQRIRDASCSLEHFMSCPDEVEFTPDGYVSSRDLCDAYKRHCRDNALMQRPFVEELYGPIFKRRGISVIDTSLPYPRTAGPLVEGRFVTGLKLVKECGVCGKRVENGEGQPCRRSSYWRAWLCSKCMEDKDAPTQCSRCRWRCY